MTNKNWGSTAAHACMALLLLSAARARATPQFNAETNVSISSALPLCVAPVSPPTPYPIRLYYLYSSSAAYAVRSAQSPDGAAWTAEATGGDVSTTTLPSVSAAFITGASVVALSSGFRMEYSIQTSSASYQIVSAKSTDGLSWINDSGVRLQASGGAAYVGSPSVVQLQGGAGWRMYYVQNVDGLTDPANRLIYTTVSTDQGLTWTPPVIAVATVAYQVGASELTDGRVRLFFTEPAVGQSTATSILSALSADNSGTGFTLETGVRVSTFSTSALFGAAPTRSTDTFRWRLYYGEYNPVIAAYDADSSLTGEPAPVSMAPTAMDNTVAAAAVTISGEIFSPGASFVLTGAGAANITPTSVLTVNDETLTGTINTVGASPGPRDLTVTNADGASTTLLSAFQITFQPGTVTVLDNLISPRTATTSTKIAITVYNPGQTTARIFTIDGRRVITLYDGPQGPGTLNLTWNGAFASGAPAPSGVYVLHVTGQKIDAKQKIVVIR
ncbi:MAG: T9SS type A sorting domain-containing protein [Elusimicrobia bacterium]|nr:T9SS type A sorting domain-containing protein [Elusimicrobiota bacterium]